MFADLKKQAQSKIQEAKGDYDAKKKEGWVKEVTTEQENFKAVQEWFDLYEPKKKKEEKKSESGGESSIKKKAIEMMCQSITKNLVKTIMECLAYGNEFAAKQIEQKEPKIFAFMNSITATFLTYRFQGKNEDKFKYLRGIAVDRISVTMVEVIDNEAQKLGKQPTQIDAQAVNKIIDKVTQIAATELEKQKEALIQKFKASPLFQATGAQGEQVDEGVQMLIDAIQVYADKKFGHLLQIFRQQLPVVLGVISQYQEQIRANQAALSQNGELSEEYVQNTRKQIYDSVEKYYEELNAFILKFLSGFFGVVSNQSEAE